MRFITGFLFSFLLFLPAFPENPGLGELKKEAVSSMADGMVVPDLKSVTVDYNPTKLVVFDNNGKYLKDIPLLKEYGKTLGTIYDVKKTAAGFSAIQYKRELPPDVIIFDIDPLKIKVRYSFVEKRIRARNISYDSLYYGRRCIVETNAQLVVFCHTQIYKFQVYNEIGELVLKVFDQNRSLSKFSSKDMKYIERKFFTPSIEYSVIRNDSLRQLKADRSLYGRILKQIKNGKNLISDIKLSGDHVYLFSIDDDITRERWPVDDVY